MWALFPDFCVEMGGDVIVAALFLCIFVLLTSRVATVLFQNICLNWYWWFATHLYRFRLFYAMKNTGHIVRSRKTAKDRYTMILNDIVQSRELTPEEKTILIYLLSLPSDWVIYKNNLIEWANFGRDRFNKGWKGLIEKGFIISIRVFDKDTGHFVGWNHIVYEEPVLDETNRLTENPIVGNSDSRETRKSENQSVYKEQNIQSNNNNKGIIHTKGEEVLDLIFEEVWTFYGNSASRQVGSKKDARAKFMRLKSNEIELIRVHLPKFVKNHLEAKKADFLPNLTNLLKPAAFYG